MTFREYCISQWRETVRLWNQDKPGALIWAAMHGVVLFLVLWFVWWLSSKEQLTLRGLFRVLVALVIGYRVGVAVQRHAERRREALDFEAATEVLGVDGLKHLQLPGKVGT